MSEPEPTTRPPSGRSKEDLPPIEPPSAGFLVQLFVIPMVIVGVIVMVWLMFSWLAHLGSSPQDLVRDLRRLNDASWQKALTLADLLRNPDYDELKQDPEIAHELAEILAAQLDDAQTHSEAVSLRVFLCRALGEFKVPDEVVPVLLRAAVQEASPVDIDVRRAALQALAIVASNNGQQELQMDAELMQILLKASRERSANSDEKQARAELRSTATYALGVLGGEQALDRLELLMDDAYPNTRYNAALGLARHGDFRSQRVLLEMLDPTNQESARPEEHEDAKASKRLLVLKNGIRGSMHLAEQNQVDDLGDITRALTEVIESDLELFNTRTRRGLRIQAEEALIQMKSRRVE